MSILRHIFLNTRFYWIMGAIIAVMMLSYAFPFFEAVAKTGFFLLILLGVADIILLFSRSTSIDVLRETPGMLSLGDDNTIRLTIRSNAGIRLMARLIDELPEQFQKRDFGISFTLRPGETRYEEYELRPVSRGEYRFGKVHLLVSSPVGLIKRRISFDQDIALPVYPSVIQMKKYELKTFDRKASEYGVKKVRRLGHSYEFEHIKQYTRGDDYRSINWKVTGRRAQLMVNQYEDERSQQVYCIIDKSRIMHMPFNGMSLFDYAVNASLVIANTALGKQDKAGLITFAENPKSLVMAERSKTQLKRILESLYNEKEGLVEANYESLYLAVRRYVTGRSLLFLYTNFESTYAMQRAIPHLKKLNRLHLLVVVFFENTEITSRTSADAVTTEDIYTRITAEQYALTKVQIAQHLRQLGIFCILTPPEQLTVTSINKYLELKSRGMI